MRFSKEIFANIIKEGAESFASKTERQEFLRMMSLMCRKMRRPAQHLLFEKTITFHGNGNPDKEKDRGFNNWCQFLIGLKGSDKPPSVAMTRAVKTIKYIRPVNGDVRNPIALPADKQHEFLEAIFTNVERLEMSRFLSLGNPSRTPVFWESLGGRIVSLDLANGFIVMEQFVNFLRLFTKLRSLRISNSVVRYEAIEKLSPPPGTFQEVLHLHFSGLGMYREILPIFCSIPFEMKYSQIVLDDQGIFSEETNLSPFLSKFKDTLEYLRFHSESTPSYRVRACMTTRRLIAI